MVSLLAQQLQPVMLFVLSIFLLQCWSTEFLNRVLTIYSLEERTIPPFSFCSLKVLWRSNRILQFRIMRIYVLFVCSYQMVLSFPFLVSSKKKRFSLFGIIWIPCKVFLLRKKSVDQGQCILYWCVFMPTYLLFPFVNSSFLVIMDKLKFALSSEDF